MSERSVSKMAVATALLPCALALVGACGGDSKSESGNTAAGSTASDGSGGSTTADGSGGTSSNEAGGSNAGGSSGSSGSSTVATTGGGPSDLSGTWDVIVSSSSGEAATSTVTLSATHLAVTGDLELQALITDAVIDIAYEGESVRATRRAESDMDLGILPLPLAGALRFAGVANEGGACDHSLEPGELSLVCSGEISTPGDLPELENAELTAVQTQVLESVFGDLGGRWTVTAKDVDCSVVFEKSTIEVDCAQAGSGSQAVNITVENGRISGSTSGGLEFTAQRR